MKVTVLFTMEGCPFCTSIKEEFKKNNIDYIDRDIHKNEDEYNQFVELTQNEFVPSMMLLTIDENDTDSPFIISENTKRRIRPKTHKVYHVFNNMAKGLSKNRRRIRRHKTLRKDRRHK